MSHLPQTKPIPARPTRRELVAHFHPEHGNHSILTAKLLKGGLAVGIDCSCGIGIAIDILSVQACKGDFATVAARLIGHAPKELPPATT